TDFFEYANGAWRKANPIPPSMVRWSRRWASGELAKDQLKEILDGVSAKTSWTKGSVEQLIGDHYASCMATAHTNGLGVGPARPSLDNIAAITDTAGIQKMIGRFAEVGVSVPFGVFATSDNHEPTLVVAHFFAGGLGLPDRDYYVKTEPRFVEAR